MKSFEQSCYKNRVALSHESRCHSPNNLNKDSNFNQSLASVAFPAALSTRLLPVRVWTSTWLRILQSDGHRDLFIPQNVTLPHRPWEKSGIFMNSLKGARSGPDNRIKGARIAAMTKIVRWLGETEDNLQSSRGFSATSGAKRDKINKHKMLPGQQCQMSLGPALSHRDRLTESDRYFVGFASNETRKIFFFFFLLPFQLFYEFYFILSMCIK